MKQSDAPEHIKTGALGERIAESYLHKRGFTTIEHNYRKKWGEIDLIMQKGHKVYFVEVKTVSYETKKDLEEAVSHGTYRPEENVHFKKLQRLSRAIQTWVAENGHTADFQLDIATVRMVPRKKYAVVDVIENISIE